MAATKPKTDTLDSMLDALRDLIEETQGGDYAVADDLETATCAETAADLEVNLRAAHRKANQLTIALAELHRRARALAG